MLEKLTKFTKILIVFIIVTHILQTLLIGEGPASRLMVISNYSMSNIRNLMTSNNTGSDKTPEVAEITDEHTCRYDISKHTGRSHLDLTEEEVTKVENELSKTVTEGGRYQPPECESRSKVAIIIPYRDREEHLKIFLRHMHPYFQRQKLEYGIFVIELDKNITFNRAILMNIGFVEASKLYSYNYNCFVFHDVDLLPEDNGIPYSCAKNPQHLSIAVDTLKYKLPKQFNFGGVSALRKEQFQKANGMSNMFFGWGGEDDDFSTRVRAKGYVIQRPSVKIGRYKMIGHTKDPNKNPQRFCLLNSSRARMAKDGLSNLKYERIKLEFRPLYTNVLVRVNETEILGSDKFLYKYYTDCMKAEASKAKAELARKTNIAKINAKKG